MGFLSNGEDNQGWKLYLTSLIMVIVAGSIVVARVVVRLRTGVTLQSDDYAIVASLLFSILLSVVIQLSVAHGYGQHRVDLSTEELHTCLKFFWVAQTPYKIVVCLNKVSAILLYMRIFISRYFRWLCYCALAIVVGSGIATVFATIFQCVPLQRSWNKNIEGTCIDSSKFWLANAVLNIFTDVVVLALPICELAKLQLKLQEKIMLHSVFLLGGLQVLLVSYVTVTSILRVTAVANSVRNQEDQTWSFIERGIWTMIEANLGIICACLIVLKQVVKHCFLSILGTTRMSTKFEYGYGHETSGTAGPAIRSPKRETRKHFRLDDVVDDEDTYGHETNDVYTWPDRKSYKMTSLAYRGASEDG
ncbi:1-acylglycerone phosphate reductase [Alternaria panax]|uniref:1-acylglycerone phosphate reductase n=1 Tax=Alternaria panax TaxID=48097 RepID=A0AAD4NTV7_9PLEO|nr:1-acylglycerone phosphate reductase [Alternaria panax]